MKLKRALFLLALSVLLTSCWADRYGVIGAYFKLAEDSRLPSWFKNTSGVPRDQLSVEITRYEATTTDKCKVKVTIYSPDGKKIEEAIGTSWFHPESAKLDRPAGTFPNWTIYRINGVDEVYEQRERNDILRIVDKPIPKE